MIIQSSFPKPSLIRIATRKSPLALQQANYVKQHLKKLYPSLEIELFGVTTEGDIYQSIPPTQAGGLKGLFVKKLEQAILNEQADIAVHSMKDLPSDLPPQLTLGAICQREDPRDVFISKTKKTLQELPPQSRIGTFSLRRRMQLGALYPHIKPVHLRGNVDTRLLKLTQGEYDGIILAAAGLIRLKKTAYITQYLTVKYFLPAIGQGAIGIECLAENRPVLKLLSALDHWPTHCCITAERAMSKHLGADCHTPVAGYGRFHKGQLQLEGWVGSPDGQILLKACASGPPESSEALGLKVAQSLIAQGANELIKTHGDASLQ